MASRQHIRSAQIPTTSAGVPWVSAVGVKQNGMPALAMRTSSSSGPRAHDLVRAGTRVVRKNMNRPTLYLLCGKIAAGKSTLYPVEFKTIEDYARLSARLRAAMTPHIVEILHLQASDAAFGQFTAYFVPPAADEGFNVVVHKP